jgi:hypothetical protein
MSENDIEIRKAGNVGKITQRSEISSQKSEVRRGAEGWGRET